MSVTKRFYEIVHWPTEISLIHVNIFQERLVHMYSCKCIVYPQQLLTKHWLFDLFYSTKQYSTILHVLFMTWRPEIMLVWYLCARGVEIFIDQTFSRLPSALPQENCWIRSTLTLFFNPLKLLAINCDSMIRKDYKQIIPQRMPWHQILRTNKWK